MAESDSQEKEFVHYTPQHPLPEEIRKMTRDDTVCQYCGVSYLIHTEIKALEDRLSATEKELEHYKGREDRESRLITEKEELLMSKKLLEETLATKENLLSMLQQDVKIMTESSKKLDDKLQESIVSASKYRQQYMSALVKLSNLSTIARQQKEDLNLLQKSVVNFQEEIRKLAQIAEKDARDLLDSFRKDHESLHSCLHSIEMEKLVTAQSNKLMLEKLHSKEERIKTLEHCEKEMMALDSQNKELQDSLKDVQLKLKESIQKTGNLQMEVDQFQQQLKVKTEKTEELARLQHQHAQISDKALKELDAKLQQKEGELTQLQKQLKNLENLKREADKRRADIAQQNVLTANEASTLKESLSRARADVEALKAERELLINAHQARIEELRESFKKKMAESELWPEKLQTELEKEKMKRNAEMSVLEKKLKESFVMELQIEKQKYDELMKKYQTQMQERSTLKAAELADVEVKHQQELQVLQHMLTEAKKQAISREEDLQHEINSLKHIIADLQDKLGRFESQGEEKVRELQQELREVRSTLKTAEEKKEILDRALQQAREEVHFLQETVRKECEERFELTDALSEARRELLALKRTTGHQNDSDHAQTSTQTSAPGLGPLRKSSSISSLYSVPNSASSHDETQHRTTLIPAASIHLNFKGEKVKTPTQVAGGSIAENRKRIAEILGKRP